MSGSVKEENIPQCMKQLPNWLVWRLEGVTETFKGTKVPYQPKNPHYKASSTDPTTWSYFGEAAPLAPMINMDGIGYVFTLDQGIIAIDLDDCINPDGTLNPKAEKALALFQGKTYIELSFSGTGYHILAYGKLPYFVRKGIEIYDSGRYFAVTGDIIGGITEIHHLQPELDALYELYKDENPRKEWTNPNWDKHKTMGKGESLVDTLNLSVANIGYPANARDNGNGEIRGAHPFHGSTTGNNYAINTQKNVWICRRDGHNSGGGALELFAVREGIIRCEDAHPGCLDGHWREIFNALKKEGYKIPDQTQSSSTSPCAAAAAGDSPCTPSGTAETIPLPKIIVDNHTHLRDQSEDAENALILTNNPPRIFVRAAGLVRIVYDDDAPIISKLDESSLRGELARCADYVKFVTGGGSLLPQFEEVPIAPPLVVVKDILSRGEWNLPYLRGIIECPTILSDNTLLLTPGYNTTTELYYIDNENLVMPCIPENPTDIDVAIATDLIHEIFCDFPFESDVDRINFYGILFTTILKPLVDGLVPLMVISKPQAGVGASLLVNIISIIATGRDVATVSVPTTKEEWNKKITSLLRNGRLIVAFDNVDGMLYDDVLAQTLTSSKIEDRILGFTENIVLKNKTVWIANGNNITLGGDMGRRTVWVLLKSDQARPWLRIGFKHPELREWVLEHRGEIVAAIITIARSWILAGRPSPSKDIPHIGVYENWRYVIGGIVEHAGYTGFLSNLEKMYEEMDSGTNEWVGFLDVWYKIWNTRPITTSELVSHIDRETNSGHHEFSEEERMYDTLPEQILTAKAKGKDFSRSIGKALTKVNGRVFPNGLKIVKCGEYKHAIQWKIDDTKKVNSKVV
jgi:hypothetical protein